MATAPSAQGIVLIAKIIKAIMKAKIFIAGKGRNSDIKMENKIQMENNFLTFY